MTQNTSSREENSLTIILARLCEGVEVPEAKSLDSTDNDKRLIEQVEENNYPYPPLTCPHREEKQIGEDCVECIHQQYETYKSRFIKLSNEKGLDHTYTLKAAFDYYSSLITQYRLTEGDALLEIIYPACAARGTWSKYYISAIQALAFLKFKQGNYQESLRYFTEQLDIMGPHEAIYENMALVYSRLNERKEASACYARAILLIRQKPAEEQKFSTLLMGLSTVLDNFDESLIVLEESLKLLKLRYDKPHSLMAKTLGAIGDLYFKHKGFSTAEKYYGEAVQIFIDTCGYDTPLTSNAMSRYAKSLYLLNKKNEAITVYIDSLFVWVNVDNNSFDPNTIVEALSILREESSKGEISDQTTKTICNALVALQNKIQDNTVLSNDLNILCLLKIISEIYILSKNFSQAKVCCKIFINCLNNLDKENLGELASFKEQFLLETKQLLQMLDSIIK